MPAPPAHPTPLTAAPLIVRGLACRRGERVLLRDLSFELQPGRVLWLRGSNGRGKTSLLRVLAGLASPEAGTVSWAGHAPRDAAYAQALLYLAHANALKDDLTVVESLAFLAALHGQAASREALLTALTPLGLHSRRDAAVRTLSQGQRRRVALARLALTPAKPLWLLDEPYDALDAEGVAALNGMLSTHTLRGGAVLLTSHLPLDFSEPRPRELQLDEAAA